MKHRLPFLKWLVPVLVIGSMLLTAVTVQAASKFAGARHSTSLANALAFSTERMAAAGVQLSNSLRQNLQKPAAKSSIRSSSSTGSTTGSDSEIGETGSDENETETEMVITGTVTTVMTDTWTIGTTVVKIDKETEIDTGLGMGSVVKAEVEKQADGSLLAKEIEAFTKSSTGDQDDGETQHQTTEVITGTVTAVMTDTWTIGTTVVKIDKETEIGDGLGMGSVVKAKVMKQTDGSLLALTIKALETKSSEGENDENDDSGDKQGDHEGQNNQGGQGDQGEDNGNGSSDTGGQMLQFSGQVTAMNGNTWTINGMIVTVTSATMVEFSPKVGSFVRVLGVKTSAGSIDARQIIGSSNNGGDGGGTNTQPSTHHHSDGGGGGGGD